MLFLEIAFFGHDILGIFDMQIKFLRIFYIFKNTPIRGGQWWVASQWMATRSGWSWVMIEIFWFF